MVYPPVPAMFSSLQHWQPGGNYASLLSAIEQLGIDPDNEISALHLVNCDRTGQAKTFRRLFNRWEGKCDFQFHFVCGCPTEMPASFSKRLIFEIICDKLDNLLQIFCIRWFIQGQNPQTARAALLEWLQREDPVLIP